jgi:hypothetical protein
MVDVEWETIMHVIRLSNTGKIKSDICVISLRGGQKIKVENIKRKKKNC